MAGGNSYNGWPASDSASAIDVDKGALGAGVKFPGGIKNGDVERVLGYVADQLNARVEAVQPNPDGTGYGCWGWSYRANVNNPSSLSCHASATAIDWWAPRHPNGSSGTFTDQQVGTIYQILDEVQGAVNWLEGYDEMHFEIQVSASTLAKIAATLPGGGTPPPPDDWWDELSDAEKAQLLADVATIKGDVAECKLRLRGGDVGPGERHEFVDMLQAIDADTHDTQYRVRGADTGAGEKHEHFDMLQGIDSQTSSVA